MTYTTDRTDDPRAGMSGTGMGGSGMGGTNRAGSGMGTSSFGGTSSRSVPDLVTKLFSDISTLFRKEGELIRAEMSDKLSQLQAGIGKIAAGAIVLLVALNVLADALVIAVAELIGTVEVSDNNTGWAALIVGGLFALVGAFLVRSGIGDLSPDNLTPDRTASQVRRDTQLAREQIR